MAKRRTAAAQERMRIISQLARKEKRDDDFGMRDEDWDVYKVINRVHTYSFSPLQASDVARDVKCMMSFVTKRFLAGGWRFRFRIGAGEVTGTGGCFTSP